MVNVLFTSVGRRVELVRAFRSAYERLNLDGSIVAVDIDPLAPALHEVDRFALVPRVSQAAYIPSLIEICRRERIDLVFPLIDPDIPVLAEQRDRITAETGATVVVVPHAAACVAADKWQTFQCFQDMGVPAPQTWLPQDLDADRLTYPALIKPRHGSSARSVHPVQNERELAFFLEYVSDPVVQEFLAGPEITNDVLCGLTGKVLAVVSRQRIEVRSGEVAKGRTIYDPRITEHCARIAEQLDTVGPITVQCLMRDGDPFFTEVNARFGGGVPLGIAAGVMAPDWLLAEATGRRVSVPPLGDYETGMYMTRFDDSHFLTAERYEQFASRRL